MTQQRTAAGQRIATPQAIEHTNEIATTRKGNATKPSRLGPRKRAATDKVDRPEAAVAAPLSGPLPERLFFRIGEVADILGVEPHVVRFWQGQFAQVRPERSSKGRFLYSHATVLKLRKIRELLYDRGFTIVGAKKALQSGAELPAQSAADAATGRAGSPRGSAPVAGSTESASERKVLELEADLSRVQRDLAGLAARLQAEQRETAAAREEHDEVQAVMRQQLRQAAFEIDALVELVDSFGGPADRTPST